LFSFAVIKQKNTGREGKDVSFFFLATSTGPGEKNAAATSDFLLLLTASRKGATG
jgi:hypothetical protein